MAQKVGTKDRSDETVNMDTQTCSFVRFIHTVQHGLCDSCFLIKLGVRRFAARIICNMMDKYMLMWLNWFYILKN